MKHHALTQKKTNNRFSMLELMAVIFVIAMLFALLLPSIARVKRSANQALCSKNLKDLHSLIMSYSTDHDNQLPGSSLSDLGDIGSDTWKVALYGNWNGHLIPYITTELDQTQWTRDTKLRFDGQWYKKATNNQLADNSTPNLQIFKDSETGSGAFRMFYCPEIINNIIDPALYYFSQQAGSSFQFPKMFNATIDGSYKDQGYTSYGPSGIPTTFCINNYLVQDDQGNALTIGQLNNFGKKALLIEGGNPSSLVNGASIQGDDLTYTQMGFEMVHNNQFDYLRCKFTFAHDTEDEFWYSSSSPYGRFGFRKEWMNQFNEIYQDHAYITPRMQYSGTYTVGSTGTFASEYLNALTIVTHINPYSSNRVTNSVKDIFGFTWTTPFNYLSDEILVKPATGKMDVLYGDGSVKSEHASWLFVNRREIFANQ